MIIIITIIATFLKLNNFIDLHIQVGIVILH